MSKESFTCTEITTSINDWDIIKQRINKADLFRVTGRNWFTVRSPLSFNLLIWDEMEFSSVILEYTFLAVRSIFIWRRNDKIFIDTECIIISFVMTIFHKVCKHFIIFVEIHIINIHINNIAVIVLPAVALNVNIINLTSYLKGNIICNNSCVSLFRNFKKYAIGVF